jgi:hypothetical protein
MPIVMFLTTSDLMRPIRIPTSAGRGAERPTMGSSNQREMFREESRRINPLEARIAALDEAKSAGLHGKERDDFLQGRIPEIVDESMRPSTRGRRLIWRR